MLCAKSEQEPPPMHALLALHLQVATVTWVHGPSVYRVGPLVVSSVCGDQITFGRGLLVSRDLADAFGLVVPRGTISLVFRYLLAEYSNQ
jgi:hypothetical protein